nr:hypothetical protein [Tanacetum cinerariifolium]
AAVGGNLLEKSPQDALTIIENKSKFKNSRSKPIASPVNACDNHSSSELAKLTHAVNQQTSAMTTAMTAMLKQFQSNPPPAQDKAVEEICVTCEGAHLYYQCLVFGGKTFPEYQDNIQCYVSAATGNYNQGNPGYRPQGVANQMRPSAITTRSRLVSDGPTIPNPPKSVNPEEDECVEETNYNPKGERFLIASRFPTPPLACAFFNLRATVTSSSKLVRDQTSNPTSSTNPTPKGRIHRSSIQKVENSHFKEHLTPVATMTDNRTMAEMLRAPTEGCAEAIVVPPILAEQFELKHSLINMMTSEQFLDSKRTIRMITFDGAARRWLEKEPPRSITTENSEENSENSLTNSFLPHELRTFSFTDEHRFYFRVGNSPGQYSCQPSGLVTEGPTVPNPLKSVNSEEDECVEETSTDPDHAEYTIKVPPPPPVQKPKPPIQRNFVLHTRDSLLPHIPYPSRMLKQKQQEKDDIQIQKFWNMFKQLHLNITLAEALELANIPLNENCSAVILKKLPEKLGDPGKFLILCGFSELKCKALADLGASINLMPLSVWKKLGLPDLIPTRMTLELANRAICTPDEIARDAFVPVGRPFLRTTRALIDVYGEEMILRDGDERLTLNMKYDTASYSNHPHRESVNLINIFNLPIEDCLEDLVSNKQSGNPTFSLHKEITSPEVIHEIHDSKGYTFLSEELPDIDSFNDIHFHFDDDPLSGSTTYLAHSLLEEFIDELALISYPPYYDDNLTCDIESDIREIEFLLYQGEDSDFKDSIDQSDLANLDDLFVEPTPEMFCNAPLRKEDVMS